MFPQLNLHISEPKSSHYLGFQTQVVESQSAGDGDCFDLETDLVSSMPSWETSDFGFGDELELGQFFATDLQKWFERVQ